ncbi:hypothetical protein M9458_007864, partial [Cirrhinus mrigala]
AVIELSAPSVSAKDINYKLSACSAPTETAVKPTVFPASLLVALSASSVSVFPRSQSMLWVSEPPAPPWWVPASPALPWRTPALSASHWRALAPYAPPWGSLVSSALLWWYLAHPALPAHPQSLGPPHGPGPPSLALFHLRHTTLLDCLFGASGSRSLGVGYVTNLIMFAVDQPSPVLDYSLSCSSLHIRDVESSIDIMSNKFTVQ